MPILEQKNPEQMNEDWIEHFSELKAYLLTYLNAQADTLKFNVSEKIWALVTRIIAIFSGYILALVAISFVMVGIKGGLTKVLGGNEWLSFILTGTVFFLALFFISRASLSKKRKTSPKLKVEECELQLSLWTQKHPFQSTGTAAAVGFVVGNGLEGISSVLIEGGASLVKEMALGK